MQGSAESEEPGTGQEEPGTGQRGQPGHGEESESRGAPAEEDGPPCAAGRARPAWRLLAISSRLAEATSWTACCCRPLCSLATFLCANAIFWFLAVTTLRVYNLLSVFLIGLLVVQLMVDVMQSRIRGLPVWRCLDFSWEAISSKSDFRPWLVQWVTESWTSYRAFLQEMSHFKQQNPGKFCLLVCSLGTFFTILGTYIPGVVLSYLLLVCAFFCPLLKCNEFGQRICNKLKPVLQKLDFGVWSYLTQWKKERAEESKRIVEDDSEVDTATLYPQVSSASLLRELSLTDTEASEMSLTENGTFNLSGGYTPQTDTSDDFDRASDQDDPFIRDLTEFPNLEITNGSGTDDSSLDLPAQQKRRKEGRSDRVSKERQLGGDLSLPLTNEQAFSLISGIAEGVIAAAVTSAITDQLQAAQQPPAQPTLNRSESLDTEEADDFELLDQSELEEIKEEQELAPKQEPEEHGKTSKLGFFSNLLGGH